MIFKKDFINDIKQYIVNEFSNDNNFSNIKVEKAYKVENTLTPPEIDIFIGDDREDIESNSYDEEKTDVVDSTQALVDKLINIMNKNEVSLNNSNVISLTRLSYLSPTKVRDDSTYVSIIRYEFKVLNNYVKIYNE